MIPMKNAASGATYMTAAKIARIVARSRRWLVADNAIAERAKTGPIKDYRAILSPKIGTKLADRGQTNRWLRLTDDA